MFTHRMCWTLAATNMQTIVDVKCVNVFLTVYPATLFISSGIDRELGWTDLFLLLIRSVADELDKG